MTNRFLNDMIITLSGKAGSGKSTIAKEIAQKLGYKLYSIGDLQRKFAEDKNISLEELRKLEAIDSSIDLDFDNYQKELGTKEDNFVIESRLGAFFIKQAYKIFLDCDDDVRVKRILSDPKSNRAVELNKLENPEQSILTRDAQDNERLKKMYGFDFLDMNNFDLVVDTTNMTIQQIVDYILEKINSSQKL